MREDDDDDRSDLPSDMPSDIPAPVARQFVEARQLERAIIEQIKEYEVLIDNLRDEDSAKDYMHLFPKFIDAFE